VKPNDLFGLGRECLIMTDETNPKGFDENDRIERDTIRIIHKCLDYEQIWFDIEDMDKYPNQDGFIEILDTDGVPLGELIVQVKRIPKEKLGEPKKSIDTQTLSYGYVTNAPFILLGVDTINEVIYWKHLSKNWLDSIDLDGADHRTVYFPPENQITGADVFELSELKSLAESEANYLTKIKSRKKIKQAIKTIYNLTNGKSFDSADLRAKIAGTELETESRIGITPGVLRVLAQNTEYLSEFTTPDDSVAIIDTRASEGEISSAHITNTKQVQKIVFRAVTREGHSRLTEHPIDWNSPEHIQAALESVGVDSIEFVLNKQVYTLTSDGIEFAKS
jgi:hypothetical protein